jgi:hypothetical protein
MATNSKVFVSPGVYTSEVDLSFVAQSVGVTTLGIVGETIIGPAFEPIFITNYNEFTQYFGGTSPEKFINTQIPKYEAAYIAKAYLQQSNQLFVTRILGLSGYDAGPSWSIKTTANVDPSTIDVWCLSGTTIDCEEVCLSAKTESYSIPFTACTNSSTSVGFTFSSFPNDLYVKLNESYETPQGGVSTILTELQNLVYSVVSDSNPFIAEDEIVSYFGSVSDNDYYGLLNNGFTATTNVFQVPEIPISENDLSSGFNDSWYYALLDHEPQGFGYTGYSFFGLVQNLQNFNPVPTPTPTFSVSQTPTPTPSAQNPCITPSPNVNITPTPSPVPLNCYSGNLLIKLFYYTGTSYTEYDDVVIGTLRSRGVSVYSTSENPTYEVTGITQVSVNMAGKYSSVLKNPYSTFAINATNRYGQNYTFETSFTQNASEYITKVFGVTNFQKPRLEVPLFCEERFQSWLNYSWKKGYIRGLNPNLVSLDSAQSGDIDSIGWYLDRWQTPSSPWVVSELRGNKVYDLFKFYTVSDGDGANTIVKISISDISFANGTFTILVRDYFDVDANPVVLEKFTNCGMDPNQNNFVGIKVGTLDGEYVLNSKYIMVEINEDAPIDALPCGFNGYNFKEYQGSQSPFPIVKSKYNYPGEPIWNPPFGTSSGVDNVIVSNGDNIRRTYLGLGNSYGWDSSYYDYIGKRNSNNSCDIDSSDWSYLSSGFHMDKNASGITISAGFSTSGKQRFVCGAWPFTTDPQDPTNDYYRLFARKYTLLVQGGFDGWDIYRESRTNTDRFVLGRPGFLYGSCSSDRYPKATGWGAFKQISIGDGTQDFANTDYYAYLLGQQTFSNPESTNINVFVTPGIDFINNGDLVESAINMIEFNRADSLYITTCPDYNLFLPTTTAGDGVIYPQEIVDILADTGIDSNYSATYYPWVLTRDTVNNTQIYIPPTAEVTRNLALTDNIAYPWFAAAGYTRGIVNCIKARKKLTQEDRDVLYGGRINPIATFSDVGTVIWGNKTLQIRESALDRINVRRLLLQARKLISSVSVRLLFEQNDAQVRQDFLNTVNPILDAIRRDRGLYDFRVTVSSDPEDIDRNQLTGKIYIKPTRSLEFIDITFFITPTGASFENI